MAQIMTAIVVVAMVALAMVVVGSFKKSAMVARASQDALIKAEVQTAVGALQTLYDQTRQGQISVAYAKRVGADMLRGMRYGADGYFFADTSDGTNVVLYGDKNVEGKNRLDAQMNGIYYVKEIIANGKKSGGGYTSYYYPKKGGKVPDKKRSYSLYFEPFDWVVGTGYYLQ